MQVRPHRFAAQFAAIVLVLIACGTDELLGPNAAQGIEGTVLLGPQCPVQTPGQPCPDLPYEAWINVRTQGGGFVTRIKSGEDGRFRVGLRPGSYVLNPVSRDPFPFASDSEVEVRKGAFTVVTVRFDTGIR